MSFGGTQFTPQQDLGLHKPVRFAASHPTGSAMPEVTWDLTTDGTTEVAPEQDPVTLRKLPTLFNIFHLKSPLLTLMLRILLSFCLHLPGLGLPSFFFTPLSISMVCMTLTDGNLTRVTFSECYT